ncbi:TPA: serine/threonine protein phosphatase [Clostridioides difficile]|uniref:Serine/threonine-protein phosphatase 1 n=1 Tax=Clostridioides difficile TaxID=1496 RepID=A0A9X8WRR0_CLODI|nr:metallophosphoesterase family protein [Clostridioides difficile]EGT4929425.1 fructose-bisphosphatase class III [Clostridioides difficile]EQH15523.1 calcineurin-like phosphoesterase family protein [Clostridioides difficile DA00210]MBY1331357.1 serine/threonine protein phosphatase [Clostridioides difficile]MBY2568620.1 serine/threonine protein phosphatase [Clostridioides difficile]MCW0869476.1 serine/threonine protein phosphatase [Clostridioides difficile]
MSDLHGMYDKFISMLEQINFNSNDHLYILGDVLDRGDKSLEIIDYIRNHKNITLLKGNHELMFQESWRDTNNRYLWFYNGGDDTFYKLKNKKFEYEESFYKYIKNLPYLEIIDNFILVHAGLYLPNNYENLSIEQIIELQEEDICVWDKTILNTNKHIKGYTIIIGHTPTQNIKDYEKAEIYKQEGIIDIDCGACFDNGKLACLRLDDMKEFYI